MLNRAFFSLQSNWIPTLVALGNLFVNLVLDLAFAPLGIWGIPLATSLVNIAGTATLARPAPPARRDDPLRRDRRVVVRIVIAGLLAGGRRSASGTASTTPSAVGCSASSLARASA